MSDDTNGSEDAEQSPLETALEAERERSAALQDTVARLEQKVEDLDSRLEQRLAEAVERAEQAESKLEDQSTRLQVLARGREEGMLALTKLQDELRLVAQERDALRKQLTAVESMQTETMAFTEAAEEAETNVDEALPSIDDLMADMTENDDTGTARPYLHGKAEVPNLDDEGEWKELLAPELIVAANDKDDDDASASTGRSVQLLVSLDKDAPIRYPLNQELMTIGRSESADIQVTGNFISRIHTRIFRLGDETVIEDAGSKNGTRVNSEPVERHVLKHGDLVRVGMARFRFVDSAQES